MEHPEDYVDSFVECYYKEFKNYPFPKERNGYKTCYDRMFTEVSEE